MDSPFEPRRYFAQSTKYNVTEGSKAFTKEQVLATLQQSCPDALAKFPAPDEFEVREHRPGQYALKVGYAVTKRSRKTGDVLWLDERADQPTISNYKTAQKNDAIRKMIGLYYSTTADSPRNGYVKNAKIIKGDGLFGRLSDSGMISPFTLNMKALLRFVLLYCGYATEHKTFENRGRDEGLSSLVRALRAIARHTSDDEKEEGDESTMKDSDGATDASDHEGDLFVADGKEEASAKRKDTMDAEVDEGAPAKKIRAC
ncbi:hypothetical protein J4E86_005156 [Alternaria arbusti]|uniref:uncharacterized protein n=1 Tax=Alternaria arbusti TaxID=232088 RepID=UPI002220CE3C|nr:uncharacterized protein J4E86_005156 [Alternaria arbusti]KAI4958016.1 hypothetical protein J4E86_005156 [Alternaria arbusti]